MKPVVYNSPSLANSDLLQLGDDIRTLYESGVRWFHIDLMDGHYVPNLCFPLRILSDLRNRYPSIVLDTHIMVDNPIDYLEQLSLSHVDYVSFHADSTAFVIRTIERIHSYGMKAGIAINPSQRIDIIEPYIDLLDMVTVMAVEPGFAGQKFMETSVARVYEIAKMRKQRNLNFLINVDGAINYKNLKPCIRCGANVIVTGIYTIFKQPEGIESACHKFDCEVKDAFANGFLECAY